jgi:hypothetical protein
VAGVYGGLGVRNVFNGILIAAISGALVVVFQYYFFEKGKAESFPDVELTESAINYSSEFSDELSIYSTKIIDIVLDNLLKNPSVGKHSDLVENWKELSDSARSTYKLSLNLESPFGFYGRITERTVRNLEENRAVDVLVEGRDAGVVIFLDATRERSRLLGTFTKTVKLAPKDSLRIVQINANADGYQYLNHDSSVLVSVKGTYLQAPNQRDQGFEPFSSLFNYAPKTCILFIIFGIVSLIYTAVGQILTYYISRRPDKSYRIFEIIPDGTAAAVVVGLSQLQEKKPSHFSEIEARVEVIKRRAALSELIPNGEE